MEVNVNMQPLREISGQMQKMTNRLALAMLLSAVIIALALVLVIYHPATWQALGEDHLWLCLHLFAGLRRLADVEHHPLWPDLKKS
jgi:uncharacterized membrane protein